MSTTPQLPNLGGLSLKPTGGKTPFEIELDRRRKRLAEQKELERKNKGVIKAPPKPRGVAPPRGRLPVERPPAAAPVQEAEDDDDDDELFAEPLTEPSGGPEYGWEDDGDDLFAESDVPPKSAEEILRDMIRRSEQAQRGGAAATPAPVVPPSPASIPEDQMDSPEPYVPRRQDGPSPMWAEFLRLREEMRAQEEANRAAMKEQKRGGYAAPDDPTPDRDADARARGAAQKDADRQRQRERERAERERDRGTSPVQMPDAYDLEDDLNTLPER